MECEPPPPPPTPPRPHHLRFHPFTERALRDVMERQHVGSMMERRHGKEEAAAVTRGQCKQSQNANIETQFLHSTPDEDRTASVELVLF